MSKRILILDDDKDFTGLLNDIFLQSSYETVPVHDPLSALDMLRAEHFDMLVTDHRMPGMTGELLIRELRSTHPTLPVIVISGFLDNDTIRSLVRDGVGGIFMKPLNVMNLLKRTAMVLDEADIRAGRVVPVHEDDLPPPLPFPFTSFPCRAAASRAFAQLFLAKAAFKTTLTLICPPGTALRQLLADFEAFDPEARGPVHLVTNRNITEPLLRRHIEKAATTGKAGVLAFQNLDHASPEARALVIDLGTRKGAFADLVSAPALLFAFTHPVDELYERGKLEEPLYLLASLTELRVPRLAECPDDVVPLAQRFIREFCKSHAITPELTLNKVAQAWLRDHTWEGNIEELYTRVVNAGHNPHGGVLTRESFDTARTEHQWAGGPGGVHDLHEYLSRLRDDYIHATLILCEYDTALAAQALDVAKGLLDTHPLVASRA